MSEEFKAFLIFGCIFFAAGICGWVRGAFYGARHRDKLYTTLTPTDSAREPE